MTLQFISEYLDRKIDENEEIVTISFYDLRIKKGLTEKEVDKFLELARIRFLNMNYQVFFTGTKYKYKNVEKIVQSNEYMVAIKETS